MPLPTISTEKETSTDLVVNQRFSQLAQISLQLSHPSPPLPTTNMSSGTPSKKLTETPISTLPSEETSSVSTASEYSLFNDAVYYKLIQQSLWGHDNDDMASQKRMNYAGAVKNFRLPNPAVAVGDTFINTEPPAQVRFLISSIQFACRFSNQRFALLFR